MGKPTSKLSRMQAATVRAYTCLFAGQIALSLGGVFGRYALQGMGPLQLPAIRLALASTPLLLRAVWARGPRRHLPSELWLGLAGAFLGLGFAGWAGALSSLAVGQATLLSCTSPFWTGVYESVLGKRPMPRGFWICLALGLASVALMLQDASPRSAPAAAPPLLGVLMGLLSGFSGGTYFVIVRRISRQRTYGTLDIITRTYSWSALTLGILCALLDHHTVAPLSHWQPWAAVLAMAVITQGGGHTAQNLALKTLRPSVVGMSALLEPLIATVVAYFLFDEHVTWRLAVGGVTLLAALGWALRASVLQEAAQSSGASPKAREQAA